MLFGLLLVFDDAWGRECRVGVEIGIGFDVGLAGEFFGGGGGDLLFEVRQVFPEHVAAVDDLAVAHVEEVYGEHVVFEVETEDVGIVAFRGGDALALTGLVDRAELVTEACGELELHVFGGSSHTLHESRFEFVCLALEEELGVLDDGAVVLRRDQAFDAGTCAALDVVLQTWPRMVAFEVDFAAGYKETFADDVSQAMGEVAGEVGAEVGRAILAQTAGDEDLGMPIPQRELDVRVSLVIAQKDVEAGLALLDQVVFECERLMLIGDGDVVDVDGLAHEGAGLGVGLGGGEEIRAHAGAQVFRFADVDDLALGVFVEIATGAGGERADFLEEIHGAEWPGRLGSGKPQIRRLCGGEEAGVVTRTKTERKREWGGDLRDECPVCVGRANGLGWRIAGDPMRLPTGVRIGLWRKS